MESEQPWIREHDTEERNKRARTAYEALLTVTARIPETEEYKNFSREVKEIARQELKFDYGKEEVENITLKKKKKVIREMHLHATLFSLKEIYFCFLLSEHILCKKSIVFI